MFNIIVLSFSPADLCVEKTLKRQRQGFFPLVYKPKKTQRFRRRRFFVTKFVMLLTTTLAFFYKTKIKAIKVNKFRFFRVFKQLRFDNSQKKIFSKLSRQTQILLRHLEINQRSQSLTILPMPYGYFYSFLLDQTFLWKSVLVELHLYYR